MKRLSSILLAALALVGLALLMQPIALAAVPDGWQPIGRSQDDGGINNSSNIAKWPDATLDNNGRLLVVWEEQLSPTQQEIYLLRWNGSSWSELNGSASGGGVSGTGGLAEDPVVAVDSQGRIIVAWYARNNLGFFQVYARRYVNGAWQTAVNVSNTVNDATHPRLALSPNDVPYLVWQEESLLATNIVVKRFTSGSWQEVGNGVSNTATESITPDIAVGAGETAVVVWTENLSGDSEIYARRWNGNAWAQISGSASGGGISDNGGDSDLPRVIITPDNAVIVGWEDRSNAQSQIYVRRHQGNNWEQLGNSSATEGGISNSDRFSLAPDLFATDSDNIYAVWQDWTAPDLPDIYIRQWNGNAWQEIGTGSASESGISDTSGLLARHPTVLVDETDRIYVIWEDGERQNGQTAGVIRGRQYQNVGCNKLTLTHEGDGADPTASPTSSAGCPTGNYVAGEEILLTAVPNPGAQIIGWNNTDDDSSTDMTNSVTMPIVDLTVSVSYSAGCFPLTLTHTGVGDDPTANPTRSQGCSAGHYVSGEQVSLMADPGTGWQVTSWTNSDNDNSGNLNNSVTMPAQAVTVAVNYIPLEDDGCFTLQTNRTGEGSFPTADPPRSPACVGNGRYQPGQNITLTAEPAPDWTVMSWNNTVNDSSTANTNSVTMPVVDLTVTVNYGRTCFPLTFDHVGQGADPQPQVTNSTGCDRGEFAPGDRIILSAAPASGWTVSGWQNSENDGSTNSSNSVLMPANPLTVSVIYAPLTQPRSFVAYLPLVVYEEPPAPPSTDEQEPNNGISSATGPLLSGLTYSGQPNDQEDIFFIEVTGSGTVEVLVQNHTGSDVQLIAYEEELTSSALVAQDATPGDTTYSVTFNGSPGRYYIRLFTGAGYNSTPYSLRVTYP